MRITKGQLRRIIREEVAYAKHGRLTENTVSDAELKEILRQHKLWVESGGKEGTRADLRGAQLQDAQLRGAHLKGAQLQGAQLQGADLRGADLQVAQLQRAQLQGALLQSGDLKSAHLWGAHLQDANLQDAQLQGADLQSVDLRDAQLQGAQLQNANLMDADLQGVDLQDADLLGAQLQNADLLDAQLQGAQLDMNIRRCFSFQGAKFTSDALPWLILHPRWAEFRETVQIEGMTPEEVSNYGNNSELAISEARIKHVVRKSLRGVKNR